LSVLLDTHVWVWWLTPDSPLSIAERSALDAKAGRGELFLAAVSLWEVQMLAAKRRLLLPLGFVLALLVGWALACGDLAECAPRRFHPHVGIVG